MQLKSLLIISFINSSLWAQSAGEAIHIVDYQTGVGARALGLGGAYVAVAEDYSAAYWNPAGLAQIRKIELSGGLSNLIYNDGARYFGTSASEKTNYTKLSNFGFVFPVPTYQGSLVFAIGFNRIKDFDSAIQLNGFNNLPTDSVNQSENILEEGSLNQLAISGAIDVTENFSFGATLIFLSGTNNYSSHFVEDDLHDLYTFRQGIDDYAITSDYNAIGFKLGGLFRAGKNIRFGATIDIPTQITVEDNWSHTQNNSYDTAPDSSFSENGTDRYEINMPFTFDFGGSVKLQNFLISGNVNIQDWSQVKFQSPAYLLGENQIIRTGYQSTVGYGIGAEYAWDPLNMKLRAGYRVIPSPLANASHDLDHKFISAGAGFLLDNQIMIDLAYLRGYWNRYSSDSFATGIAKEGVETDKVLLTISYRF